MNRILSILLCCCIFLSVFALADCQHGLPDNELLNVLILSGKNNHDWQKTTPLLIRILKDSKLFTVQITEKPDTLSYNTFKKYDLIISNWNSWPDNNLRMSVRWEDNFVKYVNEGGGALFFHAGASSFYSWEDYHRIGIGRWGQKTTHGTPTKGCVYVLDQSHPITEGMRSFYITDEIWEKTDIYPEAKVIGSLSATDVKDGHPVDVPALFVNQTGKGRSFYTIMGHDERALLNSGFQIILLRAAQWCANRKVTIELPYELKEMKSRTENQLSWNETDTSFALINHSEIIWKFNYNNRFGKPYFHPLTVNRSVLTCVAPPDHPWHQGLWFSWKYINSVNYWEYMSNFSSPETGYKSEGITEIEKKVITTNPDFSADIRMKLNYHPVDGNRVMTEERVMHISSPFSDGSYYIDEDHLFNSLTDSLVLDRTPVIGEPGGQSWGGYAGLSIRYNQDLTSPDKLAPTDSTNCRKCKWFYMGFNSITGEKAGISILQHPQYTTSSSSWYVIEDQKIPFYYYSPAVLFDGKIILNKSEELLLKYRVWILPGSIGREGIQAKYDEYLNNTYQLNQKPIK